MIQLRGLHPVVRERAELATRYAESIGIPVTITSGYRSWETQERLRNRWERGEAKYPANRPGDSSHNWGLGWDSWVPEPYFPAWDYIKRAVGFRTYPDTDPVHAEYPGWRSVVRGWPRPTEQGWGG
jgi:hypothetical protein